MFAQAGHRSIFSILLTLKNSSLFLKKLNINSLPIASFMHAHETVACSIIDNLMHATVETKRSREITSVPFHKPTEFLRTPMSLNDTMHLMRNVFCDYIEHHKSIYMKPRDLEKLRRIKG